MIGFKNFPKQKGPVVNRAFISATALTPFCMF